jgi:bla regulator protein BlaR1
VPNTPKLEGFTHRTPAPGLVGILEDKRQLRQRIAMIASFRPARKARLVSLALLVVLGVVCLTDAQGPKLKPIPDAPASQRASRRRLETSKA